MNRKGQFTERVRGFEKSRKELQSLAKKYSIDIDLPILNSIIHPKDERALLEEIETTLLSRLKESQVIVAETPGIDLGLLLKMAVNKIRPFEERGEKGFRDSIILFTIIEFAKKLRQGFHVLVSSDKVFTHDDISNLALSNNVQLVIIDSISNATKKLYEFVKEEIRKLNERRSSKLLSFLNTQKDRIKEFVNNQTTFSSLSPRFGSKEYFNVDDITALTSIDLINLQNPTPGKLPDEVKKGRVKISFLAKVELSLIINQQTSLLALSGLITGPEFQFDQESRTWKPQYDHKKYETLHPQEIQTKIERDLKIEGSAILDGDTDEYSELELERITP